MYVYLMNTEIYEDMKIFCLEDLNLCHVLKRFVHRYMTYYWYLATHS